MRRVVLLLLVAVLAGCGEDEPLLESPQDNSAVLQAVAAATRPTVPEECTTAWTGPKTGGNWDDPANWLAGRVPGAEDQACVDRGVTVEIRAGEHQVGTLLVGGGLRMTGGSLELVDKATYSLFGDLQLEQGASLSGTGGIVVTGKDEIAEGTLAIGAASNAADDLSIALACGEHSPPNLEPCPAA